MDYSNIFDSLRTLIAKHAKKEFSLNDEDLNSFAIEVPKEESQGDLSTNIAMILSSKLKKNPKEIGEKISSVLRQENIFKSVDIAGPGFINFTFIDGFWHKVLEGIISAENNFGKNSSGKNRKVNIEFVSANPTGPMHIGHSRSAIYGDVLARIMEYCSYNVTREYYVNDAGSQINTLVHSAHLRYLEAFGQEIEIPQGYYPGSYLKEAAQIIKEKYDDKFLKLEANYDEFRSIIVAMMLESIKKDLADLKITHDVFFSEKSLHEPLSSGINAIETSVEKLRNLGLIYKGRLPEPKGDDEEWEDREQELFKSTKFGDDQDRSLTKSDGTYTYFAGDIAYANSKIERGFEWNIIILGADHIGYVKRLKSVYSSLSENKAKADITLCQMVNFIENGLPVKMSKRAGNFTTVSDVIKEVGSDILRFIMLTRKNDIILDFDLDLVKSQTKENPVFYVQYAQVRALSVINNAKENFANAYEKFLKKEYKLSDLNAKHELTIIRDLALFPRIIESCANTGEVHRLALYLQNLSSSFHSFWNLGKENADYKFLTENIDTSSARLALVDTIAKVIRIGINIMGVNPLNKM